jgi:hypothetical protein
MVSPVDPNEVRLTGENSFIRLKQQDDGPETTSVSHWRILYSPAGPGHVVFINSEITDNQVRIYSDNIALARWLQEEIEHAINPGFADQGIPVEEAIFSRHGDVRSFSQEKITSSDEEISLTWHNLGEPFAIRLAPGTITPGHPHGVYSILTPANGAYLTINGETAEGHPFPMDVGGHMGTSCSLAWSETWVRPR